jgi:hypothetical protein
MAATDDNPSTPPRFLLLGEFLARVVKYSGMSEAAAKRTILNYYAAMRPRARVEYLSQIVVVVTLTGEQRGKLWFAPINPRHWRDRAQVDWVDSRVIPNNDPRYEMQLVRLRPDDVSAVLRWAEFGGPPVDAPAAPNTASPSPAIADASISAPRAKDNCESWLGRQRPQGRGEKYTEYVDTLMDACQERWTRKTVLNRLGNLGRSHRRR